MSAAATATQIDEYRLVRTLGGGTESDVFLAHDRTLDRAVVLRFVPHEKAAAAALLEGARALARVSHPSLSPVYRVREGGERPCVVQAYERGERLDAMARPATADRVLEIGRALAGALAALHAAGVAHGEVRGDRIIVSSSGTPHLFGMRGARVAASTEAFARDVAALLTLLESIADSDLRASIGRLATHDKTLAAEELLRALDALARPLVAEPRDTANPYRGLRPFEPEHASLFFGRQSEVAEALGRLKNEPWLVVAGPSGAGKSSLVRAGIVPAILAGALGERARWEVATVVPGPRPLSALAFALAPVFARSPDDLEAELRKNPALGGRLARGRTDAGLLLFVDQLEETMTLADVAERDAFFGVLARFGALAPGVRTIMTLRSDFLDRHSGLESLGRQLLRATFFLPPMRADGLRQAIVGPARARGFEMETTGMVDALAAEADTEAGTDALPLLSFALAELWAERDVERHVLPHAALSRLGGVAAALGRHGDAVLGSLAPDERREARRILLALVTASETRARRTRADLVGEGGPDASTALEALIHGRLVVAGETYEIAHEALVRAWPRLRGWLDEASSARAAAARLAAAAGEWERLGHGRELLWSARQLQGLEIAGALEGADAIALRFVDESRLAVRRARRRRLVIALGTPLALASMGTAAWAVSAARHRAKVTQAVAGARAVGAKAEETARAADAARTEAFALFEKDELDLAEKRWAQVLALEEETDRERREVGDALDLALALDPRDAAARALHADVTLERLLAAERLHRASLLGALRAELDVYDDGSRAKRLRAPGHVRIETEPKGASLTLSRYREDAAGRLVESEPVPLDATDRRQLEPGSYLLVARAEGRYATRYPLLVRRGEDLAVRIVLPPTADVPDGMIYVPQGRTLYGSSDDEPTRGFLSHQPAHDIEVGAFLIARTEVTNGQYLAFLDALPPKERAARLPAGLARMEDGRIAWKLRDRFLPPGEPYCSAAEPCVDWTRVPVAGVNREDSVRFAEWLARSGRVPGARLCSDREWERAARGADDRRYPNGNGDLGPTACTLATYGGDMRRAGPCPPGTHPASRSPFGVDDMAGSQWEWTSSVPDVAQPSQGTTRSGAWSDFGLYLAISNRGLTPFEDRSNLQGIRVCADAR